MENRCPAFFAQRWDETDVYLEASVSGLLTLREGAGRQVGRIETSEADGHHQDGNICADD